MILAIDLSTSITGWAVFDKEIVEYGHVRTTSTKLNDLNDKADVIREELKKIFSKYPKIKSVVIENAVKKFNSGFSSAHTIAVCNRFNAMVSYICHIDYNIKPIYIQASTVRKLNEIENDKDMALNHVSDTVDDFEITLTRSGNPSPALYDMADAILIGRAFVKKLSQN